MLGDPPVILLFEIADGNCTGTRTNGKFRGIRGPADECGSSVEAEEDEGWFPGSIGSGFPDEGVAVCMERPLC